MFHELSHPDEAAEAAEVEEPTEVEPEAILETIPETLEPVESGSLSNLDFGLDNISIF